MNDLRLFNIVCLYLIIMNSLMMPVSHNYEELIIQSYELISTKKHVYREALFFSGNLVLEDTVQGHLEIF